MAVPPHPTVDFIEALGGGVREIRVFEADRDRAGFIIPSEKYKKTFSFWTDHPDNFRTSIQKLKGASAYLTVNPVNPSFKHLFKELTITDRSTKDENIASLEWAFLDFDVERISGISSTDEELGAARERLEAFLADHPTLEASSIWGCSGNGCWCLVRLPGYPNDPEHNELVERFIGWVAGRYSDGLVKVDVKTKNPARVMPLVGSMKCKGVNSPERPHRMVTMESPVGKECPPLDLAMFVEVYCPKPEPVSTLPEPPTQKASRSPRAARSTVQEWTAFDRAKEYAETQDGGVSGDNGHDRTFAAACALVKNFGEDGKGNGGITLAQLKTILEDIHNKKCQPEWSKKELNHKAEDAWSKTTERGEFLKQDKAKKPRQAAGKASPNSKADTDLDIHEIRAEGNGRVAIELSIFEHEVADQVVEAISKEPNIYQRANSLVQILAEVKPKPTRNDIQRPPGNLRIMPIPTAQLRRVATKHVVFFKMRGGEDGTSSLKPRKANIPGYLPDMIATMGVWPDCIPPLEGIVEAPTLRCDGSLIDRPGYDPDTGLWFQPGIEFIPIRPKPSRDDASLAANILYTLVQDFPFADTVINDGPDKVQRHQASRAAWLAALLTPLARFMIDGPTPLFLIDANTPGTGKSKLCDIIAIIATGREMARGAYPDNDEEMQKMMLSVVMADDRLLLFDNVSTGFSIGGSALDRAITARTMKGRILGKSQMTPELPMNTVLYATGNNLGIKGDGLRRVVPIPLETYEERPEERRDFKIKGDILSHVKANRGAYVASALTILRGYIVDGMPDQKLTPMDFPAWSGLIRNAVHWATGVDPCLTRASLIENDEETNQRNAVVAGWEALCDSANMTKGMTAAKAIEELTIHPDGFADLRNIFASWSRDGGLPTARTLGIRLKSFRGRNCGGKILKCGLTNGINAWYVVKAGSGSSVSSGSENPSTRKFSVDPDHDPFELTFQGQTERNQTH